MGNFGYLYNLLSSEISRMKVRERILIMKDEPKNSRTDNKESKPFLDVTRKVLLASIGVVSLAQNEIEDFVGKLIERGEIAEKDGRKLVGEIKDKRQKATKGVEDEVSKRVQQFLERINVPTKDDIDALNKKINLLSKKIDELKK
jgi:poly(hydroxyalkanoate) granule-associated protein